MQTLRQIIIIIIPPLWKTNIVASQFIYMEDGERKYVKSLDVKTKQRYREKTSLIQDYDPYTFKKDELLEDIALFPSVSYPDIVNYFFFAPSPLTKEELKGV